MTTKIITPPNSKESEMMVLGCMLTSNNSLGVSAEALDDSDFYYMEHKILFQTLKFFHRSKKPADIHLVCEDLKDKDKLKSVGGVCYITTLAQYAGTSAYIEEYIELVKNKSSLRKLIDKSQDIEKKALEEPENASYLLEELQNDLKSLQTSYGKKLPVISSKHRLQNEDDFLKIHRGKSCIGLKVKTIQEFNEKFLGLRGLKLLAAAPNVGKTAFTIQLGLEVVEEQNACLAYFSLEMTEQEIFRRMILSLSKTDFRTFVFGSGHNDTTDFTSEEFQNIQQARDTLSKIDERIQIIDSKTCPFLDARTVINYVNLLKEKTKCERAIVIIDYLQVWPINPNIRFSSENETDKWRIGEMKKIRDAMNGDPVIVISESRKPSGGGDSWGGDMSDVMGSARGTYTPDVVILLSTLGGVELEKLWSSNSLPKPQKTNNDEKDGECIKNLLIEMGVSLVRLKVPKGRDGMERFEIIMQFNFRQNLFSKLDLNKLKGAVIQKIAKRIK